MKQLLTNLFVRYGLKWGFIEADYSGEVLRNCIIINKLLRNCTTTAQVKCCDAMVSNMFNNYGLKWANNQTRALINDIQFRLAVYQAKENEPKPKDTDIVTERPLNDDEHD
mgnify:CR=1 FL=1